MITAIVLLAVVAFVAILAAVSFANLARKRARIIDHYFASYRSLAGSLRIAELSASHAQTKVRFFRAVILKRVDQLQAKDWTDEQLANAYLGIYAGKRPPASSPSTIDELMPNVLPEASE